MSDAPLRVALGLESLSRRYGATAAVDHLDLAVAPGELVALLGPSGCGKTTTLRMVAGFVEPSAGRILLDGADITRTPAHRRGMGMVFQSYALFPHLTVAENIAFGLRRRGTPRAETADRVARTVSLLKLDGLESRLPRGMGMVFQSYALFPHLTVAENIAFGLRRRGTPRAETADRVARTVSLLKLDGLESRLPRQLSGGQQQRVAVGRALVIEPRILLLDEPFSNLDALLREGTRVELRRLQSSLRLTTLFVTHDQAEAMAISDRVAVMNAGRLEQLGTPREVYERPASRFVAGFIGRANLFACDGTHSEDGVPLDAPASGLLLVRPERVTLDAAPADGPNAVSGTLEVLSFLGTGTQAVLRLRGGRALLAEGPAAWADAFSPGAIATARWPRDALIPIPNP